MVIVLDQCYDSLTVYDVLETGKKKLKTFCGDKIPGDVKSTSNEMKLFFYSDATVAARGFLAQFSAQGLYKRFVCCCKYHSRLVQRCFK